MTDNWIPAETTTHQDHVIAHVIGATVLGYFVFDEVLYILLDIGFLWAIFLDGQMTLLPHPVAIKGIEMELQMREEIAADVDILLGDNPSTEELSRMKGAPVHCQIEDVGFFEREEQRRFVLNGEEGSMAIESSLTTADIHIYEF